MTTNWGGKVNDTGNFDLVHFQIPTATQRMDIEKRIPRIAWFDFLAAAKKDADVWRAEEVGEPDFYQGTLKPVIDRYAALGESMGQPDDWDADTVKKGRAILGDWMEFKCKVAELRTAHLMDKRFSESE